MAYGDFDVLCTMTEDLVRRVVVTVTGGTLLPVPHSTSRHHDAIAASDRTTNAEDALHEIDFEAPFARGAYCACVSACMCVCVGGWVWMCLRLRPTPHGTAQVT